MYDIYKRHSYQDKNKFIVYKYIFLIDAKD